VAALATVAAVVLAGCSDSGTDGATGSTASTAATPTGPTALVPVIDQDFPDPDTLQVDDTYYAYATQPASGAVNVQLARSTDLASWEVLDADPLPRLPSWATTGRTWAPEVTAVGDGYAMYFTAHSVDPDLQCIGVATASVPAGPFSSPNPEPLVCPADQGGAIDAASFIDDDGTRYLLWKNDGNCCGKDTWIYASRLTPDGLRLVGKAQRLVKQDQPWEGNLIEAPTLVKRNGSYVLFYSANDYGGEKYATGYATAPAIGGPWTKADGPLLTSDSSGGRLTGPGGQDVVTALDGSDHLAFHDWDDVIVYRGMHLAELTFDGATPIVDLG